MTKETAIRLIKQEGWSPSRLGSLAHRILDWIRIDGKLYVETPRFGWHRATTAEQNRINEWRKRAYDKRNTSQQP